jgi:hypothetical protein
MAIASQSLRNADSIEHGREAIEHRLRALGRVQDLLLKLNWESASLSSIVQTAVEPFGEAHLSFEPSGVVCKLDIPLVMLIPARPAAKAG